MSGKKVLFIDDPVTVSIFRDIGNIVLRDVLLQDMEGEYGMKLCQEDLVKAIEKYTPELIVLEPYLFRESTDLYTALKASGKPYILFSTQIFSDRLVPFARKGWSRWGFTEKSLHKVQVIAKPANSEELFKAIKRLLQLG